MVRQKFLNSKTRKQVIAGAVALIIVAGSLAYALLQSRDTITGNSISTASSDLLISTDGVNYSHTIAGFSFDNIIADGYPAPVGGQPIYLKNTGSIPLSLSLTVDGPPSNPASVDLNQLDFGLTDVSGNTLPRGFMLGFLVNNQLPIEGDLAPGAVREYGLQALAGDDAPAGITVSNINLAFVGTARDVNTPSDD